MERCWRTSSRARACSTIARELREGLICPVLLGAAARENGVLRLMKALRHEAPGIAETAKRLGASSQKDALAYVLKTVHLHGGKLSLTRVLAGHLDDGATLQSSSGEAGRVSGILAVSWRMTASVQRPRPAIP
jgi:elongation factor G